MPGRGVACDDLMRFRVSGSLHVVDATELGEELVLQVSGGRLSQTDVEEHFFF